jgi:hypothetical protein
MISVIQRESLPSIIRPQTYKPGEIPKADGVPGGITTLTGVASARPHRWVLTLEGHFINKNL